MVYNFRKQILHLLKIYNKKILLKLKQCDSKIFIFSKIPFL
jgi:hypothetical protein